MLVKQKLLGVHITASPKAEILEFLLNRIKSGHTKTAIVTPNPEIIMYSQTHLDYQSKLNSADIALPDGVGIVLAARLLGKPIRHRIAGVDFMLELCKASREKPLSMGFLGGGPGIAERTVECLKAQYPWLNVVFVAEEWDEKGFACDNTKHEARSTEQIDILFVAFGAPKQEEWIFEHLDKLPVKAAMGVGGSFDYIFHSLL